MWSKAGYRHFRTSNADFLIVLRLKQTKSSRSASLEGLMASQCLWFASLHGHHVTHSWWWLSRNQLLAIQRWGHICPHCLPSDTEKHTEDDLSPALSEFLDRI